MAKYDINGSKFEFDDTLQGEALQAALQQTADYTAGQNQQKFLSFLGKSEGADYNTIVGGRQTISDFTSHPNVVGLRTKEGPSTAAGRYQITGTTYHSVAPSAGVSDFSPESQDKVALHLISQKGAMDDVTSGNFNGAIAKLGGVWASLPSSKYSQPKRTQQWVDETLGQPYVPPPAVSTGAQGYQPFGTVIKNNDQGSLNTNADWLKASAQIYSWKERKTFSGTDDDLADYGKSIMGYFNNNVVAMTADAAGLIAHGTQDDKNAFLYMMDQYDENNVSWAGTGRAALGMVTDPVNLVGIGTLGTATVGKLAASVAAKEALKKTLLTSLGRTGIQAGIMGAGQGTLMDTIKQGVEVTAGKKDSVSLGQVAGAAGLGLAAGVTLGTAADALLTVAAPSVKLAVSKITKSLGWGEKVVAKEVPKDIPVGALKEAPVAPKDSPVLPEPVVAGEAVKAPVAPTEYRPGPGGTSEPLSAEITTKSGEALTATREFRGKYNFFNQEGEKVGTVIYTDTPMGGFKPHVEVPEQFQRKGYATAFYDFLENDVTKKPFDNSGGQSEAGAAFREARREAPRVPTAEDLAPIPTTLTQDELKAAGVREQRGRPLWDDIVPTVTPDAVKFVKELVIPMSQGGLRDTARDMPLLTKDASVVADQLRPLSTENIPAILEILRTGTTIKDQPVVWRAMQILHDEVRTELSLVIKQQQTATGDALTALIEKRVLIEARNKVIGGTDMAMGSHGGSLNRQRLEGLVGLQGSTPESLAKEHNLTPAQADALYVDLLDAANVSTKAKAIAGDYDQRVQAALDAGDHGEVGKLLIMKGRELAGVAEEAAPGGSTIKSTLHKIASGLVEVTISNLFTIKTVLINAFPAAVKSLTIPFAKYLVTNPLEKAARAEMGAHYAAMGATVRAAFQVAVKGAFGYEQSILTRDTSRLMEGEMVMKGRLGGALRFFPRVLNATDEFLAQINYAGFVSGKAANTAAIDGVAKGLEGKALNDFIADAVKVAKGSMYEKADETLVQPIINKGVNLGLSGDALLKYVETEGAKNGALLKHGSDKEALDLVRDVLYKRAFSGGHAEDGVFKAGSSNLAKSYETFIHKNPSFSLLIGQLFFRTPIRVFEEGIRMTPGVQILAPGFMKDLAGSNGTMRQVRAQGEALMGLSVTGFALSLYASGNITGSGTYSTYKQDKTRKDGPGMEPYSIKLSDGSTWSFKNMDPISTPLKIMINAFEEMDQLKIKEAQEGFVNLPAYKQLVAKMMVGTSAITSAITDANLVAGLKGTMDLGKELSDPQSQGDAIIKALGGKLAMLVPNTLHKIAQMNDPRMRDPSTFFQVVEAKIGHGYSPDPDVKSAFAYDPLGQVRELADIGSMYNIFSTSSQEEKNRGHSQEHQIVMLEMDRLTQMTGATFSAPPPTNPITGSLDLRTMLTKDKSETMYDRWQRNYRDLNPDKNLVDIAKSAAPDGTFKYKGMKVEMLQQQMKFLQDAAFSQLLTDERIRERLISEETQKARAMGGLLDFNNRNK